MDKRQLKKALICAVMSVTKRKYLKDVQKRGADLQDFTILSSDCLAGVLYHDLNRKFLSPTINVWFEEKDFLKFCNSLDYYLSQEFSFLSDEEKDVPYPVGCLGEGGRRIFVWFEHYRSNEESAAAWEKRKKRINWENLYVVMSDLNLSDEDLKDFYRIPAKRKILFTWDPKRADGKEIFRINRHGKDHVRRYSNLNLTGFRDFELFFDYVKWLKMEDDFIIEAVKE